MTELECPSLEYVLSMSWSEFLLRSDGYYRKELNEWKKVRRLAYSSLIAPHQDPKKLPKTEEKYMPLEQKKGKSEISDAQRAKFLEETKKYLESTKNK